MSGTNNSTTSIDPTGDARIDGIMSPDAWGDSTIRYSMPSNGDVYDYSNSLSDNFNPISDEQEKAVRFGLNEHLGVSAADGFSVEGFTSVTIVENTTASDSSPEEIRVADTSDNNVGSAKVADFPGNYHTNYQSDNGDVWFGPDGPNNNSYDKPEAGNYEWRSHLHELGHALGLTHGHDDDGYDALPPSMDSMEYSVMTYRSFEGQDLQNNGGYQNEPGGFPQTYMMSDIAALQEMYGADYTINGGDTTYSWNPGSGNTVVNGNAAIKPGKNRIFATIWDGGGDDTYDLSSYSTDLDIDLRPGESSLFSDVQQAYLGDDTNGNPHHADGNIYNALLHDGDTRSLIENATGGSSADTVRGNQARNTLTGGGGNDILYGGLRADRLTGESGNDTIRGGRGEDKLFGKVGDDTLYGEGGSDTLYGKDGKDTFAYQGGITQADGADELYGGSGQDKIFLENPGTFNLADASISSVDKIDFETDHYDNKTVVLSNEQFQPNAGFGSGVEIDGNEDDPDTLDLDLGLGTDPDVDLSGVSFANWNDEDEVVIQGDSADNTVSGTNKNDTLYGRAGNDRFASGAGNDILYGGLRADTLIGGSGSDTAVFNAETRSDYEIATSGLSFKIRGPEGDDQLENVETFKFSDATVDSGKHFSEIGAYFENGSVQSYGGNQDQGNASVLDNGRTLELTNNAWKQASIATSVDKDTELRFDFKSTTEGEIHGIGLDNDNTPSSNRTFQLAGSQDWGIQGMEQYAQDIGNGWQQYQIPIGDYFTGNFGKLTFAMDDDAGVGADSQFRDIEVVDDVMA